MLYYLLPFLLYAIKKVGKKTQQNYICCYLRAKMWYVPSCYQINKCIKHMSALQKVQWRIGHIEEV